MPVVRDELGRFMVHTPAGGSGGGVTSAATRPATTEEITTYHTEAVEAAQAALDDAKAAHKQHIATLPTEPAPTVASAAQPTISAPPRPPTVTAAPSSPSVTSSASPMSSNPQSVSGSASSRLS